MQHYTYFLKCLKEESGVRKLDKKTISKHYSLIFSKLYNILDTHLYLYDSKIVIETNYNIVPASRPRMAKNRTYYAQPYRGFKDFFKNKVIELLTKQASKLLLPLQELSVPVSIHIIEYRRIANGDLSIKKLQNEELYFKPDLSTPDLDNIEKSVLDAFNNVLFKDDSSVYRMCSEKYTSHNDYTRIEICYAKKIVSI